MDETYLRSVDDPAGVAKCFLEHGVVGVTDVLTKAECEETLAGMGMPPSFDIRNPATYNTPDTNAVLNKFGVVGTDPLFTRSMLRNRCHPKVARAYRAVYEALHGGPVTLLACHDRAAIMRPTLVPGGAAMDTEYKYPGLHLDVDPQGFCAADGGPVRMFLDGLKYRDVHDFVAENNAKHRSMGRQVQGVLNLVGNREEDGGFQCVPMADCMKWMQSWCGTQRWAAPPEPNGRYFFSPKSYEEIGIASTRVPCPAGTLILFDACLPHGTLPNRSTRPRAIQFLRYIPAHTLSDPCKAARASAVRRLCREAGFEPPDEDAAEVLFGKP
jgi:hypothetical protein